jgi:membrane-associated phospholipid phosphatase
MSGERVKLWLVPLLLIAGAGAILLARGDEPLFRAINQARWAPDGFWAAVTMLGDASLLLALALLLTRRHAHLLPAVLLAAVAAGVWVQIMKALLDVPRPSLALDAASVRVIGDRLWRHSFPSGHAAAAFAAAGIAVLAFRPGVWSLAPVLLASLVAVSRVVVGAHWPLDVVVGALGGWLAAALGLGVMATVAPGPKFALQRVTTVAAASCAAWLIIRAALEPRLYGLVEAVVAVCCLSVFAMGSLSSARRRVAPSEASR